MQSTSFSTTVILFQTVSQKRTEAPNEERVTLIAAKWSRAHAAIPGAVAAASP